MERAALVEWLYVHRLFQDFFVLSTIKLHCMGDCLNTGSIELSGWPWVMQQTRVNSLAACIQVSIDIAVNLIASYASTGRDSFLASQ